jgi:hypothetical protein
MGNLFAGFLVFVLLPLLLLVCGLGVLTVGGLLFGGGLLRRPVAGPIAEPGGAAPSSTAPRPGSRNPFLLLGGGATVFVGVLLLIPGVFCGVVIVNAIRHDQAVKGSKADARRDLRALLGAQRSYRMANGGFYDRPPCLARPSSCIPGYAGPPFLDQEAAALPSRSGNAFTFHPGPAAPADALRDGRISPSSLDGYAFVAKGDGDDPGTPYNLCVDARGLVCYAEGPKTGEGGVCACWAPGSSGVPQAIDFVHGAGKSPCPQLVGQLEVYNEHEREIVTDVRTVGSAPLSFGPNLTLARHEGGAIDVFFTCGGKESFTAEVTGLKPEDVHAHPDTEPAYPSVVTVRGTIAP